MSGPYDDSLVEDFGFSYDEVSEMSSEEVQEAWEEANDEYNRLESIGWDD